MNILQTISVSSHIYRSMEYDFTWNVLSTSCEVMRKTVLASLCLSMDIHSQVNPIPKGQLNTFNLLLFLSHFINSKEPLDACVLNFPRAKNKNSKLSKFCFCFCCLLRNESYQYCKTNKAHPVQTSSAELVSSSGPKKIVQNRKQSKGK